MRAVEKTQTGRVKASANDGISEPQLYHLESESNYNALSYSRKLALPYSLEEKIEISSLAEEYISKEISKAKNAYVLLPQNASLNSSGVPDSTSRLAINNETRKLSHIGNSPELLVFVHCLESLENPLWILRDLRIKLKSNKKSRAIFISSDGLGSVSAKNQLPVDPHYYRVWSQDRLIQLLNSSGFRVEKTLTDNHTCIVEVTSDETFHREIIQKLGLPLPRNSMIITAEHADTKSTGGIGSYVKEVEQVTGNNKPMVLVAASRPFKDIMVTNTVADNIIDIHEILRKPAITEHTADWESSSVAVYRAVMRIAYIYDQLHRIEYQEYLGIGARLAQARRANMVYPDITCIVRGHGSQVYIDRASFEWSGMEKADVFELERLSVELADEASFPTQYLKDLYTSTGYKLPEKSYILRLPYSYPEYNRIKYRPVTELIFLGKRSAMKGYPAFYNMLKDITDKSGRLFNAKISHVRVIAAHGDAGDVYDAKIKKLLASRGIKLTIGPLPRHEVLNYLQQSAQNSIVCLPYGGDNHPVTILEMIAYGCRFVAFQNGGIPELIPQKVRARFTCPADSIKMAEKVNELSELSNMDTELLMKELHDLAIAEQEYINDTVRQSYSQPSHTTEPKLDTPLSDFATVMVPIYGTDLKYIKTLITCLNRQSLIAKEILFINDSSPDESYVKQLHNLIKDTYLHSYRIIDHKTNRGLAGARNTGLANCRTKYLINVDSDDAITSSFVRDYVEFMEINPGYSAVTCALESFVDSDGWNRRPLSPQYSYVGLGDCLVLGVSKNIFGHAGSCVNVKDARALGGWDESDRSKWEDWAFFLKMASLGMHIFNFPKVNYFYRVSPQSMVRTYANYPAELRISRNIAGISIWESHRLYAFIKDEASRTHSGTQAEIDTLTYRIAKRVTAGVSRFPVVKRTTKSTILFGWKAIKFLRSRK